MDAKQERVSRKRVNEGLAELSSFYHSSLPNGKIDEILTKNGFKPLEEGIYCGRSGVCNEQVGERTWLRFDWYKMESGRFEVTLYVS